MLGLSVPITRLQPCPPTIWSSLAALSTCMRVVAGDRCLRRLPRSHDRVLLRLRPSSQQKEGAGCDGWRRPPARTVCACSRGTAATGPQPLHCSHCISAASVPLCLASSWPQLTRRASPRCGTGTHPTRPPVDTRRTIAPGSFRSTRAYWASRTVRACTPTTTSTPLTTRTTSTPSFECPRTASSMGWPMRPMRPTRDATRPQAQWAILSASRVGRGAHPASRHCSRRER